MCLCGVPHTFLRRRRGGSHGSAHGTSLATSGCDARGGPSSDHGEGGDPRHPGRARAHPRLRGGRRAVGRRLARRRDAHRAPALSSAVQLLQTAPHRARFGSGGRDA
ncbi:MAG TPA: hypothetical protein DEF51_34430 [Myxococcales bacterium]|nr:hypothetical protein [Myxococcales bacterium]